MPSEWQITSSPDRLGMLQLASTTQTVESTRSAYEAFEEKFDAVDSKAASPAQFGASQSNSRRPNSVAKGLKAV